MDLESKNKNQFGTIILIAVMIMATLLTAGLGTGTLVINIINQSASIDYSISAYYAAESGIEKNLYMIRKDDYVPDLKIFGSEPDITDSQIFNSGETLQAQYDLSAVNGKDEIVFDLKEGQEYVVDIFDPNISAYEFVGYQGEPNKPIVSLSLAGDRNALNTVTLQITIVSWSQGEFYAPSAVIKTIQGASESSTTFSITPPINVSAAHSHKVRFRVFDGDLENLRLSAADSGNGDLIVPGVYVLVSKGSYPNVSSKKATQVLSVEMPILEPAYGLFNYVIFSEGDITKSVNW